MKRIPEDEARPICRIEGCKNKVKLRYHRKDSSIGYHKTCSFHSKRYKYTKKEPIQRICKECQSLFTTIDYRKIFCSRKCMGINKSKRYKKNGNSQIYNHRKHTKLKQFCEVCGYKIIYALHKHHLMGINKRPKGQVTPTIILCANCHNILHHKIGWNIDIETYTKEQTINIIKTVLTIQ